MNDIPSGVGATSPSPSPSGKPNKEQLVGKLGNKTVTAKSGKLLLQQESKSEQEQGVKSNTPVSERKAASHEALSAETTKLLIALVKLGKAEAVESLLKLHVTSLEHFVELTKVAPVNISEDVMEIIANHYGSLRAEKIISDLTNNKGTPEEKLDALNIYFVEIDHTSNPVRTTVSCAIDDFLQMSKFPKSIKKPLQNRMEANVFQQLHSKALELDKQVITHADTDSMKKVLQQATQRSIELNA